VDKTSLQSRTRTGLFQLVLLAGTIQSVRLQCLEEKCVAIRLSYASALGTRTCSSVSVSQNAILRNVTYLRNTASH
jgi:hypothetical protein